MYQDQVELYNDIGTDVGSWWGELEVWIAENLDAFLSGLPQQSTAERLLAGLKEVSDEIPRSYLEGNALVWSTTALTLRGQAADLREGAADFVRGLRSGNPAVRAAAEAANPRGMRWQADEAEDLARRMSRVGKAVPALGWAIDIWTLGSDTATGNDPSSSAVNIVGGIIGGAAATAAVGALAAAGIVTLPVWGTAVVVAGAAVAVGAGAVWAYENWVPQDVRESIDAGMEQAWDATADFAEDAWENTGEFLGDAGHEVGKAWKSVFG